MDMILGGESVRRERMLDVHDPFDGSLVDRVPAANTDDVAAAVAAAVDGYRDNRDLPAHARVSAMLETARIVEREADDFAVTIAREGSKTIREARKEVSRAVHTLTLSAEEGRRILGETIPFDSYPGSENRWGYYFRFPIGVIAAITPFNDPLNLVAHKVGPALVAGNSVVVKPATVTPLSALKLGQALLQGGFPPRAVSVITGRGEEIGDALVGDPRVRMVSFTGGVEAGKRVAACAGIKKIAMELGSNSPVIVLDDADLEQAVELAVSDSVYLATEDGAIRLFQSGAAQLFPLAGIDRALVAPASLSPLPASGRLLVADRGNKRIVALSSEGVFLQQWVSPASFTDLRGIAVHEADELLYILAGGALYRTPLPPPPAAP